jgi:hypothetical protein
MNGGFGGSSLSGSQHLICRRFGGAAAGISWGDCENRIAEDQR